jgi:hypothetical protein
MRLPVALGQRAALTTSYICINRLAITSGGSGVIGDEGSSIDMGIVTAFQMKNKKYQKKKLKREDRHLKSKLHRDSVQSGFAICSPSSPPSFDCRPILPTDVYFLA